MKGSSVGLFCALISSATLFATTPEHLDISFGYSIVECARDSNDEMMCDLNTYPTKKMKEVMITLDNCSEDGDCWGMALEGVGTTMADDTLLWYNMELLAYKHASGSIDVNAYILDGESYSRMSIILNADRSVAQTTTLYGPQVFLKDGTGRNSHLYFGMITVGAKSP